MKAKYRKRFKRDIFTIIATLIGMIFISGCASWYGEGTVVSKTYSGSYTTLINCGKNVLCPITHPECYRLKVAERNGDEHEVCVSQYGWEKATLGHRITITKD